MRKHNCKTMGGVTKRKCTCAYFDADVANLPKQYTIFHARFSTHAFPGCDLRFLENIFSDLEKCVFRNLQFVYGISGFSPPPPWVHGLHRVDLKSMVGRRGCLVQRGRPFWGRHGATRDDSETERERTGSHT